MKFGKTARLILVVGIVIIGIFIVYRMNIQEEQEQERLNTQVSATQLVVPKLTSDRADLENQLINLESNLAEAKSSLSEAKVRFPEAVESIEYDEVLFRLAQERDLEITTLTASEPGYKNVTSVTEAESDTEVEGVTYTVTSFTAVVQGKATDSVKTENEYETYINQTLANILSFVNAIATGNDFTTATVESVHISVPEPLTTEEIQIRLEGEGVETTSATITVVVYSYQG